MKTLIICFLLLSSLLIFSCSTEKENDDLEIYAELVVEFMRYNTHRIYKNNQQDYFENIIILHDTLGTNLKELNISAAIDELNKFIELENWRPRIKLKEEDERMLDEKMKLLYSDSLSEIKQISLIKEIYDFFIMNINFGCGFPSFDVKLVYGDTLHLKPNTEYKIPYEPFKSTFHINCFKNLNDDPYFSFETPDYTNEIIKKEMRAKLKNELSGEIISMRKTYFIKLEE